VWKESHLKKKQQRQEKKSEKKSDITKKERKTRPTNYEPTSSPKQKKCGKRHESQENRATQSLPLTEAQKRTDQTLWGTRKKKSLARGKLKDYSPDKTNQRKKATELTPTRKARKAEKGRMEPALRFAIEQIFLFKALGCKTSGDGQTKKKFD